MKRKWIFTDWRLPSDSDLALIKAMGFTDVVLGMGDDVEGRFHARYSTARIVAAAEAVRTAGARVHIMTWARRQRTFISDMARWLVEVCQETQAATALLDAEALWHHAKGFSSTGAAALVNAELMELSCPVGVTGLSNLHSTVRPLLDVCDYGLGQAYSIWKPGAAAHWSHSSATEPGQQQAASWASWGMADKPLVMGLSNYWAARPARDGRPKMSARESLEASLDGAEKAGATEVAYWSLKWLAKDTAAAEVAREITVSIPIDTDAAEVITVNLDTSSIEAVNAEQPAAVQWLLVQLGYDLGKYGPHKDGVDGFWGKLSQEALDDFRRTTGLPLGDIYRLEDVTALVAQYRIRIG